MNGKVNDFDDRHICPKDGIACRAPEPGTSVIRWTRYDGTPETLPEEGEEVLFHSDEYGYEVVVLRKCPALIWTHFVYAREMREHFLTVNAGDLWAYLPEPPEGMK